METRKKVWQYTVDVLMNVAYYDKEQEVLTVLPGAVDKQNYILRFEDNPAIKYYRTPQRDSAAESINPNDSHLLIPWYRFYETLLLMYFIQG
jgi:hypothetical protein